MLKQWLDDNLPDMVERLVREEIARVAARRPVIHPVLRRERANLEGLN